MITALTIVLLLIYFWYFTAFSLPPVDRPSIPQPPSRTSRSFTHELKSFGTTFMHMVNGIVKWIGPIPPGYLIHQGQFHSQDPCYNIPDGTKILATGKDLYDRLRQNVVVPKLTFEPNASLLMQDGHVFYFTCQQKKIHSLEMCPPGHIFQNGECQPIDICTGRNSGLLLPDPLRPDAYYECLSPGARHRSCPKHNYFLHNACHSTKKMVHYCRFNTEPQIIDDFTVMRCRNKRPVIDKCPPKTRLFGTFRCESSECVGKRDGTRLGMSSSTVGPFHFSPGYIECLNERATPHFCPSTWDNYLSEGGNLTHLPQVFDGQRCSIPSFCKNVYSSDPDVIVPVHEFTKRVKNWEQSDLFDQVSGYTCNGNVRARTNLRAGQRINKKFKRENACDGTVTKVIVAGFPEKYFDCSFHILVRCPPGQIFDSLTCRNPIPHAHKFKGIGLFTFTGLDHDGWLEKWHYSSVHSDKVCQEPESTFIPAYNLCSHPDCAVFPFLNQVPFPIHLKSGGYCKAANEHIVKYPSTQSFNFWSQRLVDNPDESEPCTMGKKVESGNFVVDSSLYATCDEAQPFVFCPSPLMKGIAKVENVYTCVGKDPPLKGRLEAGQSIIIQKDEVKQIRALPNEQATVTFDNNPPFLVSDSGFLVNVQWQTKLYTDNPLYIEYHHRVTYPPSVAFDEQGYVNPVKDHIFLVRRKMHTKKPVQLPTHTVSSSLDNFRV